MNELAISLIWLAVRLTLFGLLALPLYFWARRRGPAAGSLAALASMLMAGAMSAVSLAPWPSWWNWSSFAPESTADVAMAETAPSSTASATDGVGAKTPGETMANGAGSAARDTGAASSLSSDGWWQIWRGRAAVKAPESQAPSVWAWSVVAVMVGASLAGLGRLLLGLWAVRRSRFCARPIRDPELDAMLADLTNRLNYRGRVALGESPGLGTPATVGWLRPLILLPANWRQWTAAERRAVLAHELAHIRRADFLAGILAQASLACHFWHPLMHWFAGRLRLEQELAADACGVSCAGGREAYLVALAQMALRQDRLGVTWAARPFLPGRGIFLRRIEMLRSGARGDLPLGRAARGGLLALLLVAGLAVSALRSPDARGQTPPEKPAASGLLKLVAQADSKPRPPKGGGFDLTFVPSDALALIAIKPGELLARPDLAAVGKLLDESSPLGISLSDIELAQLILISDEAPQARRPTFPSPFGLLLRAKGAAEFTQLIQDMAPDGEAAQYLGQSYFRSPSGMSYLRPDDRTIIVDTEQHLFQYMLAHRRPRTRAWGDAWSQVATGPIAAMLNVQTVRQVAPLPSTQAGSAGAFGGLLAFAPLWEETQRVVAGVQVREGKLLVEALAICESADSAQHVTDTATASVTLAGNLLSRLKRQAGAAPAEQAGPQLLLVDAAEELLSQVEIRREENTILLSASATADASTFGFLVPAVKSSRIAAHRAQSANNLKQISLAMHNYADTYRKFPPAVVIGPDGKTPHSWRVELLPFLGHVGLFQQYKMDEPWDSAANLLVLAQMPAVFRAPDADPRSTTSSYYVITGEVTAFPPDKKIWFQDIVDGTSNTLITVEAQRDIPWTKPEDIAYDPSQPLPKLGMSPEGFNAGLMDGSVKFISNEVDESTLRALFTRAGGELIPKF